MKLYYAAGACSLAPHILLEEADTAYTAQKIQLDKGDAETPEFLKKSPMGYVPVLELSNGDILTEGVAIQTFIADSFPEAHLVPRFGTFERAQLAQWMTFISSEIHKGYSPLFNPKSLCKTDSAAKEVEAVALENLEIKLDFVNQQLDGKRYVLGEQYSIADAYLFTVFGWSDHVGLKTARWPNLLSHAKTMKERPAVRRAMLAEGLIK